jgi:hypothetical protein
MSFYRLIFYGAMVGGWAAYLGWLISELILMRRSLEVGAVALLLTAALVGAAIAGGLNFLAGAAQGAWKQSLPRLFLGLAGGFLGGALGGWVGNLIYANLSYAIFRALGWMVMGMAIGSVEGIYDLNGKKIRNGVIGGGVGGLLGGLLFDPINGAIGGIMASRATAFVILGLCIGLFVGLAQVILKEAWLTVLAGFRPGRQVILNRAETVLGTSEKAQLPFIAYGAKGVEPIHVRIVHQPGGGFVLYDNQSRTGTQVNGRRVEEPMVLRDGDQIQLGPNVVRYSERFRRAEQEPLPLVPIPAEPVEAIRPGVAPAVRARPNQARSEENIRPVKPAPPPLGEGAIRGSPPIRPAPVSAGRSMSPPVPPRAAPPAAPAPAVPVNPPAPAGNACPICSRPAKGPVGKRVCENCGIKF